MADSPALDMTWLQDAGTAAFLDLAQAVLDDIAPTAIQDHESADGWRVFFRSAHARDGALAALAERFAGRLSALARVDVPDDGWAQRSQAALQAVRVGRIVVTPPWAPEAAGREGAAITVVIEPSMGFGTGHHATTRLCLRMLQRVPVDGRRVVDVGTGSGVLAIAAWKLGASETVAIDCDPDALANAASNVRLNGARGAIDLVALDLGGLERARSGLAPADLVLANLTASTLQRHAAALEQLTRRGGRLIVSGFAPEDSSGLEHAFGRRPLETETEDAWAAAMFEST